MSSGNNQGDLKKFFIKLIAITFAIIVIINVTYNLILADKLETINKLGNSYLTIDFVGDLVEENNFSSKA